MSRICKTAIDRLKEEEGINVGLFRPITAKPFPYDACHEAIKKAKKAICIELNMGQMIEDIRLAANGIMPIDFFGKAGGVIPSVEETMDKLTTLLKGDEGENL